MFYSFVLQTITDLVYLLGINFFGVYVRLLTEVAIRRAFLDRRECVEGNLLLRYARDQEVRVNFIELRSCSL